jgi:hypothetical protein
MRALHPHYALRTLITIVARASLCAGPASELFVAATMIHVGKSTEKWWPVMGGEPQTDMETALRYLLMETQEAFHNFPGVSIILWDWIWN